MKDISYRDKLEPIIRIPLRKRIKSIDGKEEFAELTINEPCFVLLSAYLVLRLGFSGVFTQRTQVFNIEFHHPLP